MFLHSALELAACQAELCDGTCECCSGFWNSQLGEFQVVAARADLASKAKVTSVKCVLLSGEGQEPQCPSLGGQQSRGEVPAQLSV